MTTWDEHVEAGRNEQPLTLDMTYIAAYNRCRDQEAERAARALRVGAKVVMEPNGREVMLGDGGLSDDGAQMFTLLVMPRLRDGDQA